MAQRSSRLLLTVAVALGTGLPTASAAAPVAPVAVGEVVVQLEANASRSRAQLERALRAALAEELTTLSRAGTTGKRPLVVSAALTKLLTEQRERRARSTATISL